jgi:hypothetical protein
LKKWFESSRGTVSRANEPCKADTQLILLTTSSSRIHVHERLAAIIHRLFTFCSDNFNVQVGNSYCFKPRVADHL